VKQGCPSLANDTGCSTGFDGIGQTWSTPIGGNVGGYVDGSGNPKPIVFFGGGFDDCLNADAAAYPTIACSAAKGRGIYVLDATTGVKLALLATAAPVITDLTPIDLNFDGKIDFAYAADVAGGLYRINFASMSDANPENSLTALTSDNWTIVKIGSMSDNKRRFYNAPVAAAFQGTVFVTIGSGDRERPLEANYPYASNVQNRFYALIDKPYQTFVAIPSGPLAANEVTTIDMDGNTMLPVVANANSDVVLSNYNGWYMDLPDRGEQVANPAAIAGGKVFFNTFQPGGASNGICERPLGIGTSYEANLFKPGYTTGEEIAGGGIPIPPVIATVKIPLGCTGDTCTAVAADADPCAAQGSNCETRTVCIGCKGFSPIDIVPDAAPVRQRVYYTEDADRQ
jgi:type IV pilus assembly protein PilY1